MNRGTTLIELILYTGLVAIILTVLYQLFTLAGFQKLNEITTDELYANADQVFSDIEREVKGATSITTPLLGESGSALVLETSGGAVTYSIDGGRILKQQGEESGYLTNTRVIVSSFTVSHVGPSILSPSVAIGLTLQGSKPVEGRVREKTFQTAATVR